MTHPAVPEPTPATPLTQWVALPWRCRSVEVEVAWVGAGTQDGAPTDQSPDTPCMVFLHEGLGSVALWKDFPAHLCQRLGWRGLVYSRPGYGRSTPRMAHEAWGPDFMHRQAHEVLPLLLAHPQVAPHLGAQPPWLFGHSDGASIALLHAARHPQAQAGLVLLAPHTFVEDKCTAAITLAHATYASSGLRQRLARYHADVDSAFGGWSGAWLNPAFKHWNIDAEAATLRLPILAIQGEDDEYGTLEQIHRIARNTPHTRALALPNCGHSPHRDQTEAVIEAVVGFVGAARRG